MGPISYYTFERIGVDHTITAAFAPEHAGGQQVLFENDFEGDSFPGNGWSLKTTNSSFTWYSGKQTNLNATKVARVDFDGMSTRTGARPASARWVPARSRMNT